MRPLHLALALVALSACKNDKEPVLLASGTYTLEPNSSYGAPVEADLDGVLLELDLDALTAEFVGTENDRVMELAELPMEDWAGACPIGGGPTPLETFEVQESISLVGVTLEVPYIMANGCRDDEGTTVSKGWLSSKDLVETKGSAGPFELFPAW